MRMTGYFYNRQLLVQADTEYHKSPVFPYLRVHQDDHEAGKSRLDLLPGLPLLLYGLHVIYFLLEEASPAMKN